MRRGRIAVAAAFVVMAAVAVAVAGYATRAGGGAPGMSNSERLGAKARAFAPWNTGGTESGEAEAESAAAYDYENRAYPQDTIAYDQTAAAIAAGKKVKLHGVDAPKKWKQVGTGTTNIDVFGTQTFLRPTQWSGRVTALQVDAKHCNADACRLYLGAAGGGVWVTNNALAETPNWHDANDGLDSLSVGALLIDPTDRNGNTLYLGTGEPNGSSESEAGIGLYKSTDGANHWSIVPGSVAVAKDRGIGAIAVDPNDSKHLFLGTARARHGMSGAAGGRWSPPNAPRIGLYESKDGGQTFSLIFARSQDETLTGTANGCDYNRGAITDFEFDPNDPSTYYFTVTNEGVFRGKIGGTISQIFTEPTPHPAQGGPGCNLSGIRFQIATASLPNGKTRIYMGEGRSEAAVAGRIVDASQMWRVDDGQAATGNASWTLLSSNVDGTPGYSSFDFCRTQCSYDMPVASPPGKPDEVWIGGVTFYSELPTRTLRYRSNGRAVMRSVNAGVQFTDQTGDARHDWEAIHPDIHDFAFAPGGVTFVASDGGVTRTNGTYVDFSSDCDDRNNLQSRPVSYQDCKTWLSSIPERLITMNANLPTLQLQDLAVDPTDPFNDLIAGTQDNGSPFWNGSTWGMNVLGDGGPPAIDKAGAIHYHQYSGVGIDMNFDGTESGKWLWIGDPLFWSPEGLVSPIFYGALIADPVVSKTAYTGIQHVWRTKLAGGDEAYLRAHCDTNFGDKTFTGANSGCGDWVALGGAAGNLSAGPDSDKGGDKDGFVVAIARASSDTSTMWVGTRRGRIFITKNADAEPATAVTFTRLDTAAQPRRFPSGISVDPADANHAFVSFSGFDAYTPATPGHVFDVRFNAATGTATWKDLSYDLGDQPVTDVQYDGATGDLYASTDFGVDRLVSGTKTWIPAASDLPPTATYALTLAPGKLPGDRLLYAATHGRGAWRTELPAVKRK